MKSTSNPYRSQLWSPSCETVLPVEPPAKRFGIDPLEHFDRAGRIAVRIAGLGRQSMETDSLIHQRTCGQSP